MSEPTAGQIPAHVEETRSWSDLAARAAAKEDIAYFLTENERLRAEVERLTERVHRLEQERAKARIDAFINAARIADSFTQVNTEPARATAATIAARLRARAAVGTAPPEVP